ncbi:MAG: class I SAM-dependent DNA methyltransferase, partial [Verrucomicrobia bacterium]|nr:class I SAM-dependent DNA methyltransferase [Verrucomicrobiota bacterium]
FEAMNTRNPATGGRFKGVRYFNGGLFAEPARLEIQDLELVLLRKTATFDWSKVQPEIFGTLFQHSMDAVERHAFGAQFTHPIDIMKIVGPTIVEPWREQIEGARTLKRLRELLHRLHNFRVLDPACGCGNFLYIAYRELKRLEARIYERMAEFASEAEPGQMRLSFLSAQNFYGLDILPFAVEIAKVTMMIARKLAIDELHITERALPLDNLDQNFIACDALISPVGQASSLSGHDDETGKMPVLLSQRSQTAALQYIPTQWPQADVIIGNAPFLGAKLLKPERGPDYVNTLRRAYADVPGMADYCVYWFRKAHDHLPPCTASDPVAGRAGLVGTQNIRNNQSRVGGLDHVVKTGTIVEAVENQPWSGEANVHVSIANWAKTQDAALLPKARKLWFKVETSAGTKPLHKRGSGPASKEYELDFRECEQINSALSDQADVSGAKALNYPGASFVVCQGITPGHEGFVLSPEQRQKLVKTDGKSEKVIIPYLIGRELVSGTGQPERYLIDFGLGTILDAQAFGLAFEHVKQTVLPAIQTKAGDEHEKESAHKDHLDRWWLHWRPRRELITAISKLSRFLVCSRVTKRPIFVFADSSIRPGDALQAFAFEDDYSFGILQSSAHWLWFITKCSKFKSDFRYTPESVFDTFPWPQFVGRVPDAASAEKRRVGDAAYIGKIDAVAAAAREVRRVRAEALPKMKGGLRALYRTLELPGANPLRAAHAALDAAVLAAYGFNAKKDLLAQLLALNQEVAAKIEKGDPVTAPGVPKGYPDPAKLVTEDCIRAAA